MTLSVAASRGEEQSREVWCIHQSLLISFFLSRVIASWKTDKARSAWLSLTVN
jgi:hypothetical protein